jgi:DnaA-homolog protein
MRQLPLELGHRDAPTFDDFLVGENAATLQALQAWIRRWVDGRGAQRMPGAAPAPLYLWGSIGSGKTHLLAALVDTVQAHGGRVAWVTPETPLPWAHGASPDVVLIDDCDRLDASAQQAAFAAFVEGADTGCAIVAAGRQPPVDLPVREDLRTRLGWGDVHVLLPLSEAETRATLRREADRRGIFLGDEVMAWLLTRFQRDLRSLMALLDRLDRYALSSKRAVTLPLLRRMLDEESDAGGPAP